MLSPCLDLALTFCAQFVIYKDTYIIYIVGEEITSCFNLPVVGEFRWQAGEGSVIPNRGPRNINHHRTGHGHNHISLLCSNYASWIDVSNLRRFYKCSHYMNMYCGLSDRTCPIRQSNCRVLIFPTSEHNSNKYRTPAYNVICSHMCSSGLNLRRDGAVYKEAASHHDLACSVPLNSLSTATLRVYLLQECWNAGLKSPFGSFHI
jgi:hypothetical protein